MATVIISMPGLVPTYSDTYSLFVPYLTYPPTIKNIDALPSITSPVFPTINAPNIAGAMAASEGQAYQMLTTETNGIAPIASYLGSSVDSLIPSLPGLSGISFTDLLSVNPSALISAITAGLGNPLWLYAQYPLFNTLNIPNISTLQTARSVVHQYTGVTVTTAIASAITTVTNDLGIPNMGALPTFPSMASIISQMIANIPGATSLPNAISIMMENGTPSIALFQNLSFPGFSSIFTAPSNVFPSISSLEIEIQEHLLNLINTLSTDMLQPILTFIQNTLSSYLSFTFSLVDVVITI